MEWHYTAPGRPQRPNHVLTLISATARSRDVPILLSVLETNPVRVLGYTCNIRRTSI